MQLIVNLDPNNFEMPYDHSYQLYSSLLSLLDRVKPGIASQLHGYSPDLRFSLSQIMPGGKRRFTKLGFSGERFIFFISSFNKSLLSEIRESLEKSGSIVVFNNKFQIHSMLYRDVNPSSEIITIHSRSPIILKTGQGYLFNEPKEDILKAIDSNIRSKYVKANGREPNIRFIQIQDIKTKKVGIKGVKIPGFLINFTISADLDVLSFILTIGLGSKNKLGFGFIEEEKQGDFHGF